MLFRIRSKHRYAWPHLGTFVIPEGESVLDPSTVPAAAHDALDDLTRNKIVEILGPVEADEPPPADPPTAPTSSATLPETAPVLATSPVEPLVVVGDEAISPLAESMPIPIPDFPEPTVEPLEVEPTQESPVDVKASTTPAPKRSSSPRGK